jgi:crossover junction endodeoxyribonuclease RusA
VIDVVLPYPPSVNHYYRHVGPRVLISREGRCYREQVGSVLRALGIEPLAGPLALRLRLHPPDRRRRDLDNTLKALLDALQHGRAYVDDSQVALLLVEKAEPRPGGRVRVSLRAREDLPGEALGAWVQRSEAN